MKRLMKVCRYGKLIGLLGVLELIWDAPVFRFFWLFWLLGFVEIFSNFPVFVQNLKLAASMLVVPLKYGKRLPNKDNTANPILFLLPFSENWVVVNGGIEKAISHSWAIPTQRYAYDFVMLDNQGKSFCGEQTNAKSYYCYGKDILAPADGVVVGVLDGQPDSVITKNGIVDCSANDIYGNHIIIKHSDACYSVLAHLKGGTICARVGEAVRRGQMIAQCGNSGNSSEPHLHFQIQNGKSRFFSAGIPICFDGITSQPFPPYGKYDSRPITGDLAESKYIMRGQAVQNRK